MVKILMAGILAVGGYFLWQYYFAAPKPVSPTDRLLLVMDGRANEILGPLSSGEKGELSPTAYTQELRALREDIKNMQATAPAREGRRYAAAIKLCDALISASDERIKHISRIYDTRAKSKPSALATDPVRDRVERLAFFENGIARSWDEASRRLRKAIDGCHAELKKYEHPD